MKVEVEEEVRLVNGKLKPKRRTFHFLLTDEELSQTQGKLWKTLKLLKEQEKRK